MGRGPRRRCNGFYGRPGGELLAIYGLEGRMYVRVGESEWVVGPDTTAQALPVGDGSEFVLAEGGVPVASFRYEVKPSVMAEIDPTYEFDDFGEDFPSYVAERINREDDDRDGLVARWSDGMPTGPEPRPPTPQQ